MRFNMWTKPLSYCCFLETTAFYTGHEQKLEKEFFPREKGQIADKYLDKTNTWDPEFNNVKGKGKVL